MPPSTVFDTISVDPWCRSACRIRSEMSSGLSIINPSMGSPPASARQAGEHFSCVVHCTRAIDDIRYFALLVDDEGDPVGKAHHGLRQAKEAASADRAIGARDRSVGICKQREIQSMHSGEALVGGRILR